MRTFVLLFQCKDQKGIVAGISEYIFSCSGNIITADQHTTNPEGGYFFIRVEFVLGEDPGKDSLFAGFSALAAKFGADWRIYDKSDVLRMGLLVSRPDHCLHDILYLYGIGDLLVKIPFVISNFEIHRKLCAQYNIPFIFIPADKESRREQEILSYVKDKTDFLVLARYMLVFSNDFLRDYANDIINIHHGLLPSFKGANPYRRAFEQGVKVIGATAHFVNERLDEGPIISQSVESLTHKDDLNSLIKKGRDLEKKALSSAISSYIDYRIIRHSNKTIVF